MASIIRRKYTVKLPDGRKETRQCEHYTIEYRDAAGKVKRLTPRDRNNMPVTQKAVAEAWLIRWRQSQASEEVGFLDPHRGEKSRPLSEHLGEYIADLLAAGRDAKYIANAEKRLKILADECRWQKLVDVTPNSFIKWRGAESKRAPRWKGREKKTDRVSATTLNQYLDTARAFLNWCASSKRVAANPLTCVGKVSGEKKRKRRALADDEVTRLLAAAPADRKLVYRVGMGVGLRRDELAQLQWGDVRLNAIRPYIALRAEATKARRADRLELPATLADDLRQYKPADASEGDHVFSHVPSLHLWKHDLKAAGIAYKDGQGRQVDFHAGTRKTLCTRMQRAGVPMVKAMRAMRHTDIRLTAVDYVDDEQLGGEGVTAAMPELLPVTPVAASAAAMGA
jgi:integrase